MRRRELRPRSAVEVPSTKVDLATLTPDLTTFLGKSAYLQLAIFENLSRVVRAAPSTEAKSALSQVAGLALAKHQGLVAEIERHGADAAATMQPFVAEIDEFQRVTEGNDWYESLTSCYLTAGFLDDFLVRLASRAFRVPRARGSSAILEADSGEAIVVARAAGRHREEPAPCRATGDVGPAARRRHHAARAVDPAAERQPRLG